MQTEQPAHESATTLTLNIPQEQPKGELVPLKWLTNDGFKPVRVLLRQVSQAAFYLENGLPAGLAAVVNKDFRPTEDALADTQAKAGVASFEIIKRGWLQPRIVREPDTEKAKTGQEIAWDLIPQSALQMAYRFISHQLSDDDIAWYKEHAPHLLEAEGSVSREKLKTFPTAQ